MFMGGRAMKIHGQDAHATCFFAAFPGLCYIPTKMKNSAHHRLTRSPARLRPLLVLLIFMISTACSAKKPAFWEKLKARSPAKISGPLTEEQSIEAMSHFGYAQN